MLIFVCCILQTLFVLSLFHVVLSPSNALTLTSIFPFMQGGCIIRANFLDEIKQAYERNPALENLLMDEYFAKKLADHQESWRRVIKQAIDAGAPPFCWRGCCCGRILSFHCLLRGCDSN